MAVSFLTALTEFAEINGKRLAYRCVGEGLPIILCNRFRGTMDTWDPLFLEELAKQYQVITFDYSGIGYSDGELPLDIKEIATQVKDIADYLSLKQCIILGWSFGGFVAQTASFMFPELVSKLVLLGTNPPGHNEAPIEAAFFEAALKPINDFEDEVVLFFEPASETSRKAAELSHDRIARRLDISKIPATLELFQRYFAASDVFKQDALGLRKKFLQSQMPVLMIIGDHDVSFPAQNWLVLAGKLNNTQMVFLPRTGHGPQHQYPEMTAGYIDSFVKYFNVP